MDTFGLVVHDPQSFLAKTVNYGMDEGIFTRDRADEIIRISVAMANKYVLHKEVDFRSTEELAKVQETILKLIGLGLEIKSNGNIDEGIGLLMDLSPVELFRLAHTRIEKLRHRWQKLLRNHRIEILVSAQEYQCLSDYACQRLGEMSIFTESELHTIGSLTLEDELFSNLTLLEYYESELERHEFILKLRQILPFGLLNRSTSVRAENVSEVDSIRDAMINTLVISAYVDSEDPISVTMKDIRDFLASLDLEENADIFPEHMEDVLIDLIHELGEGLEEKEASLLTKEILQSARKLLETTQQEWDTVTSASDSTFFKRWSRMAFMSDVPEPVQRILSSREALDEFDFEVLLEHMLSHRQDEVLELIRKFPWNRLAPDQAMRLFHELPSYQEALAAAARLENFSAQDIVELVEGISPEAFEKLVPALRSSVGEKEFSLEDLELLATLPQPEASTILRMSNPPQDYDARAALARFREGSERVRQALFYSCRNADFFPELILEAWSIDQEFVKQQFKALPSADMGPFLQAAAGGKKPEVVTPKKKSPELRFRSKELNALFKSLPAAKRASAVKFFLKQS